MKKIKEKAYYFKGFGFRYLSTLTDENETIKGGGLYLFGKKYMTVAISNGLWTTEDGEPYNFKLEGNVLFIKKVSIEFGDSDREL